MFRQFFLTIPKDLDEAAKIDGANTLWIFIRIILPLSKPVVIIMVVIGFLESWNDFFGPLIYLNTPAKYTLSLGLANFQRVVSAGGQATEHLLMAASMVIDPAQRVGIHIAAALLYSGRGHFFAQQIVDLYPMQWNAPAQVRAEEFDSL